MIYSRLDHVEHPHDQFKLDDNKNDTIYICDGCKELGHGPRYTCSEINCDFHLHIECANPREIIHHSFYAGSAFSFLAEGIPNRECCACGRSIKGYIYQCSEEGLDLHPCCANLPHHIDYVMEGKLTRFELHPEISSKCFKCDMKELDQGGIKSWSYKSKGLLIKRFHFHVACVKDTLDEIHYAGGICKEDATQSSTATEVGPTSTETNMIIDFAIRLASDFISNILNNEIDQYI